MYAFMTKEREVEYVPIEEFITREVPKWEVLWFDIRNYMVNKLNIMIDWMNSFDE